MAFGINVLPLVTFIVPVLPAFAALLIGFSRYDGHFRDNIVFLYLLFGLGVGALTSLLGVALLATAPLLFVTSMALVNALVSLSVLNRKKWQGDRHAVFNGGAFGTGVGLVWSFALGYLRLQEFGVTPRLALDVLLISTGVVFTHFAAVALLGSGVADRTPFRVLVIAAVALAPVTLALNEYWQGGALLWPVTLTLYGIAAFVYARARILPLGLTEEARRTIRRREREKTRA